MAAVLFPEPPPTLQVVSNTIAPLLTTNILAEPEFPRVRLLLLQIEPAPTTNATLERLPDKFPIVASRLLSSMAPLLMTSWLKLPPLFPMNRLTVLLQIEPAPEMNARLLLEICPTVA